MSAVGNNNTWLLLAKMTFILVCKRLVLVKVPSTNVSVSLITVKTVVVAYGAGESNRWPLFLA